MSSPLSIGVPAYNHGQSLQATLASLVAQEDGHAFAEIVVSDNHSTDSTAAVLEQFCREHPGRVRVVQPPAHLPSVAHWNFLAAQLTTDWISLFSSDDLARPHFCRSLQDAIALSEDAVLARAGWQKLKDDGSGGETFTLNSVRTITKPAETLYDQRFGPKASFAAFALRRAIWERVGGFPEETTLIGDWGMWLLAGALGDTVRSREVIAGYRIHHHGPAVYAERKPIEVHEMYLVYRDILPRATQSAGLGVPTWIAAASQKRFRTVTTAASVEIHPKNRAAMVDALRPWAESVDGVGLLRRFEGGERIRSFNLAKRMKPVIKRVISAVR